mmetsp:Transcript_68933/g.222811  ORF Transcript_68933/g.222811 Transcript_68933/m.222811 type:complete len:140 (-) Transcript_68933:376-795(-)
MKPGATSAGGAGSRTNSLMGVGIIVYLVAVSMQTLVFSFRYSVYSLGAAAVLAIGELPFLFSCSLLAMVAGWLTPTVKALAYALVCLGGIACFVYVSWSPLLLTGHLLVGLLSYRCWSEGKDRDVQGTYAYEQVDLNEI